MTIIVIRPDGMSAMVDTTKCCQSGDNPCPFLSGHMGLTCDLSHAPNFNRAVEIYNIPLPTHPLCPYANRTPQLQH